MKKETIMKLTAMKKRVVLLLAAAMLLPMFAVGCQSAQDIIKQREKADEIGQRAEQYMQEKYNRGFKVRKCEAAEGEEYEGDFFISFNNGIHAFYNSKKDKFYDDHQTEAISEAIMRDIFLPMCNDLGVTVLNVNDKSVYFNLVYQYHRAGKDYKFSMFEKPFTETAKYYTRRTEMSVTTDNLILLSENRNQSKDFYNKIKDVMANYFHNQKEGSLDFYVVNDELQSRLDFDPDNIDESVTGCLAHIHFGEKQYCSVPNTVKIEDGLYSKVCGKHDFLYETGDITLVPVENPEEVLSSMKATMDKQDVSLIDKYTGKKRNIVYEDTIYKLEFSQKINRLEWEDLTLAFIMRTSDGPITEYVEMNEKQHAFFAYDMNGGEYNATCLCSQDSRSTLFTFNLDSEVYFWFGSLS